LLLKLFLQKVGLLAIKMLCNYPYNYCLQLIHR